MNENYDANIEVKSEKKKENENINNKENKKNDGLGDAELKKKIEALLPNLGTGYEFSEKEKELLRSYSGKGGSKDTTDRGILDEYYTPDEICNYMYRYGYKKGNVLEPSCATSLKSLQ